MFALLAVLLPIRVYLDTVILLGAISIGYVGIEKLVFAVGASLAASAFLPLSVSGQNGLARLFVPQSLADS